MYICTRTHELRKYLRLARLLPTTRSRSRHHHHHHPTLLANFTPFRFFARPSFFSSFRVECQHYSPRYEINQDRPIKSFSYAFSRPNYSADISIRTRKIGGRSSGKRIEEGLSRKDLNWERMEIALLRIGVKLILRSCARISINLSLDSKLNLNPAIDNNNDIFIRLNMSKKYVYWNYRTEEIWLKGGIEKESFHSMRS